MNYRKKAISALMLGSIVTVGALQMNIGSVGAAEENTPVVGVGALTESFLASVPVEADQMENEVDTTNAVADEVLYPDFVGKCMADVDSSLNVRLEPSTDSQIVGKMFPEAVAEVVESKDGWTKIVSGNVEGYIFNEYVLPGDEAGKRADEICLKSITVETQTLNVREEQSTDSAILVQIPEGKTYKVVAIYDEWIEIQIDGGTGYVSKDYVNVVLNTTTAKTVEEIEKEEAEAQQAEEEARKQAAAAQSANTSSNSTVTTTTTTTQNNTTTTTTVSQPAASVTSGTRADVVNYALQFVGNPYVYGGTSLTNGTDCSGFTMSVYAHFGYSLYRSSRDQIYNGTNIPVDQVKPGDLLFYSNNGKTIGHVAMYIGDGKIVHASTAQTGIIVSNMYYMTPCGATRIIND